MPEQMIDVANFRDGIQDAPAFGRQGASRMKNYVVDFDGEVVPRKGYQSLNPVVYHIDSGGQLAHPDRDPQEGPLIVADNSSGTRLYFRLPVGATHVLSKDKLFIAVPLQEGNNLDPNGFFVDLSETPITDGSIYRWTSNTDRGGDHVRPSTGDTYFTAQTVHAGIAVTGVSHPVIVGLTGDAPNNEAPIEIAIRVGPNDVEGFKISIQVDESFSEDDTVWRWGFRRISVVDDQGNSVYEESEGTRLLANSNYVWQWAGTDGDYDDFEESLVSALSSFWRWLTGGKVYRNRGNQLKEISQDGFENCYLEVEYTVDDEPFKYRYYLHSHRGSNIGQQIATSLQAGLSVAQIAPSNKYVLGAGAAVAVAGTATSLLTKSSEGERVRLSALSSSPVTPSPEDGGGFQPGQYVFCHTYSDENRLIETIPSRTTEMMVFDFPNLPASVIGRTRQNIEFTIGSETNVKTPNWEWATHINIYAARTTNPDSHNKIPQETGLDFHLVGRLELSRITNLGRTLLWADERFYSPDNNKDDPSELLESFDNDLPLPTLENVASYGSRIWGVDTKDNSVRYSKLGPYGYHYFPSENALIPQILTFDNDYSPIVKIHPASNDSMLYVFKEDVIHVLRGHGEIRGLYIPSTPIDVDIDASVKIENTGTSSPRSVCTLKNMTMFLGSDRILYSMSGIRVEPFSIAIQPYIERLTDAELADVFAWEYRNCYHLALPDEVLVLDLQKGYWTVVDWALKDAFWVQAQNNTDGNKLYAIDADDNILQLYTDETNEPNFMCEWESNAFKLPYQSVISGVYVFHDGSARGKLEVSLKINNGEYITRAFTPSEYNRFRQGFHGRGHRAQIRVRDSNRQKLRIDRIQIGIET